jgi:hypothetical protein
MWTICEKEGLVSDLAFQRWMKNCKVPVKHIFTEAMQVCDFVDLVGGDRIDRWQVSTYLPCLNWS